MKVMLWYTNEEDFEVGLLFRWDETQNCWVCKMDDDHIKELGALPVEDEE